MLACNLHRPLTCGADHAQGRLMRRAGVPRQRVDTETGTWVVAADKGADASASPPALADAR